jgi:very-short-patch-repair endonuclease
MHICKICNRELKNKGSYTTHTKHCIYVNDLDFRQDVIDDYVINFLSIRCLIKKYNISTTSVKKILGDKVRTLSEFMAASHKKYPDKYKHSEDTKMVLREKRLSFMRKNPEKTAWRQRNISYPESLFLTKINELGWDTKYLIIKERSIFPYFIDFAFENQKIAVEIDGSQHKKECRAALDVKKDKLLNDSGWVVLRFTAKMIQTEIDKCFSILENYLKSGDIETGVYRYGEFKKQVGAIGNTKFGMSKKQIDGHFVQRKVERPSLEQLFVDIKNLGFSGTGRKYGVSDNAIRKWIKIYKKHGSDY